MVDEPIDLITDASVTYPRDEDLLLEWNPIGRDDVFIDVTGIDGILVGCRPADTGSFVLRANLLEDFTPGSYLSVKVGRGNQQVFDVNGYGMRIQTEAGTIIELD